MGLNEKMTTLADEIRELSGTTTTKSIDAMTTDVDAANTEIAEQAELIAQIATALEGKAGGGVSSGPTVGTFVVTDNGMYEPGASMYTLTNDSLDIYNRTCVLLTYKNQVVVGLYRTDINNDFSIQTMVVSLFSIRCNEQIQGPSTIQVVGIVPGEVGFLAW